MQKITKEEIIKLCFDSQLGLPIPLEMNVCTEGDARLGKVGDPAHYYRFLYYLAEKIKPELVVELGTSKGISSACLADGNEDGKIITIDINDAVMNDCKRHNIEYLVQDSLTEVKLNAKIDILFIDTLHDGLRPGLEYENWINKLSQYGIVLFDDININEEMRKFWRELRPSDAERFELPIHGDAGFGILLFK